jgi:hypothetical protein
MRACPGTDLTGASPAALAAQAGSHLRQGRPASWSADVQPWLLCGQFRGGRRASLGGLPAVCR